MKLKRDIKEIDIEKVDPIASISTYGRICMASLYNPIIHSKYESK
jgi:hypothetical protein